MAPRPRRRTAARWLLTPILVIAVPPLEAADAPTYEEIEPIVATRCRTCHRPGGPAPFALLGEHDLRRWAATIRGVVADERMPPWHADGPRGVFINDRRLGASEKAALLAWIDGRAAGDASSSAAARPSAAARAGPSDWRIGEPDLVFELPADEQIPAEGVLPYRYLDVPTGFEEDVWVEAIEVQPGNPRVVHHAIVDFYDPRGFWSSQRRDARTQGSLGSYVPGDVPLDLPPGTARRIPADAVLKFQMHYTPSGKLEIDRTRIGLRLARGEVELESRTEIASNPFLRIPAGEPAYQREAELELSRDVRLAAMTPHMHLRGKAFVIRAVLPDGSVEALLEVPRYDFNWQTTYRFIEPRPLPAGTMLRCTATWDNSPDNPANPDPTRNVGWGEQTDDEMMLAFFELLTPLGRD